MTDKDTQEQARIVAEIIWGDTVLPTGWEGDMRVLAILNLLREARIDEVNGWLKGVAGKYPLLADAIPRRIAELQSLEQQNSTAVTMPVGELPNLWQQEEPTT